MTETGPLAAFVKARLDEDEAAAKAASPGPWFSWIEGRDHRGGDSFIQTAGDYDMTVNYQVREYGPKGIAQWQADQDYIACRDPARALREVEADRALLHAYEASVRSVGEGLSRSLRQLVLWRAAVWDDHADYSPAWKPETPA